MRTVYLGTSEFAAGVLRALAASPHRPELVITRPDRPRGRGRRLASPPVADAARELGLDLIQPDSVGEESVRARIAAARPDVVAVCAFGALIREPLLSDHELGLDLIQPDSVGEETVRARIAAARPDVVAVCAFGALIREPLLSDHELLNVHPSLLPLWRGAAPIERAIISGDRSTGVSIMRLTAGLDSGPVCAQTEVEIAPQDTYGTLAARLQTLGGELLIAALDARGEAGGLRCHEQDDALATYAEKLSAGDRVLDPSRPAPELERVVRALNPHIGATVEVGDGHRLGVWEARALPDTAPPRTGAGTVSLDGPRPVLGCAEGALELVVVQPPGRRAMSAEDFLRGRRS